MINPQIEAGRAHQFEIKYDRPITTLVDHVLDFNRLGELTGANPNSSGLELVMWGDGVKASGIRVNRQGEVPSYSWRGQLRPWGDLLRSCALYIDKDGKPPVFVFPAESETDDSVRVLIVTTKGAHYFKGHEGLFPQYIPGKKLATENLRIVKAA